MADSMDRAQRIAEESLERAIAAYRMKEQAIYMGECEDCFEDIPAERRKALPFVRRCVDCQRNREKDRKYH